MKFHNIFLLSLALVSVCSVMGVDFGKDNSDLVPTKELDKIIAEVLEVKSDRKENSSKDGNGLISRKEVATFIAESLEPQPMSDKTLIQKTN